MTTATPGAVRQSIEHLVAEHLVTENLGEVRGLHPLRSEAALQAIIGTPPPDLSVTLARVLTAYVPTPQSWVLRRPRHDTFPRASPRFSWNRQRYSVSTENKEDKAEMMSKVLSGLRLADFTLYTRRWMEVLEACDVPPAMRPITLSMALIDSELMSALDSRVYQAITRIRKLRASFTANLRDQAVADVGQDSIARILNNCSTVRSATNLLAPRRVGRRPRIR